MREGVVPSVRVWVSELGIVKLWNCGIVVLWNGGTAKLRSGETAKQRHTETAKRRHDETALFGNYYEACPVTAPPPLRPGSITLQLDLAELKTAVTINPRWHPPEPGQIAMQRVGL